MTYDLEILERLSESLSGDSIKASRININNVLIAMEAMQSSSKGQITWKASAGEIATGDIDQTVRVLWQAGRIWMDKKVLQEDRLKTELENVTNAY